MVYYRAVKFNIFFVCKTEDGREVFREEGRMVAMAPYDFAYKKFESKEEADATGPIAQWAKDKADKRAEKDAKDYCGEATIFADDWGSFIIDTDEGDDLDKLFKEKKKVPKDILELIANLMKQIAKEEKEIKRRQELVKKYKDYITKLKEIYKID